ncbi:tRNA (adenosine(37)-N6)-threonylcarbamoyltransferase complex ATPase subunit type 1 TsaE [Candidatus Kaiserbacteria bacterium]|nr:tRNA (adenosine(37)-N6)-threonylcarbamoyltransferase complex ATPase subunit type 1 TsaE [Candidatus Kaiserbacteria bacterium]NCT02299.1 tRNA (adenosine(37)-N6)-threonylcarbamoyltransferase complex ATPase subunit type 1 TsaE [Candidatus Parcubacteria bacterium]
METTYLINQPVDFETVINDILRYYKKNKDSFLVLALEGDLGAGKTTFTQQLGRVLGVRESITSPTFTIMKQYALDHTDFDSLVHIDGYRFESESEAEPLHLDELLVTPRAIICIEWPERIASCIPAEAVMISITIGDKEQRIVQVTYGE